MATDTEQLAFDVGALSVRQAPPLAPARPLTKRRRHTSETSGGLVGIALRVDRAGSSVQKCQLLFELMAAAEEAIAVSIRDAHAEQRSWRKLSLMLEIPFQTLHRRYAPR